LKRARGMNSHLPVTVLGKMWKEAPRATKTETGGFAARGRTSRAVGSFCQCLESEVTVSPRCFRFPSLMWSSMTPVKLIIEEDHGRNKTPTRLTLPGETIENHETGSVRSP
jgi:hypothetical protein